MHRYDAAPTTVSYLNTRYETTKQRQTDNGVQFRLKLDDYWRLISKHKQALARINRRYQQWLAGDRAKPFIPGLADQNPCAHSRKPRDMMVQGWATSLFQASQQWSTRLS